MNKSIETLYQDIIKVILNYKKTEKIVIFGSRATGEFKYTSDIDIAIFGLEC